MVKQTRTRYIGKYLCDWGKCKHFFEQEVGVFSGEGKHQKVTDSVICPHCKNKLKPIDDAIDLKEIKVV
jgi:hypothetical protein